MRRCRPRALLQPQPNPVHPRRPSRQRAVSDPFNQPPLFFQHLGLYAYRRAELLRFATLQPSTLEQAEKLEQLRLLQTGGVIVVDVVQHASSGIDTPADYAAFVERQRKRRKRLSLIAWRFSYNVCVITRIDEPIPLPLLITGVAGVAGYNALDYFRARYPGQVIAIRQEDNWRLSGEGIVACDAGEPPPTAGAVRRVSVPLGAQLRRQLRAACLRARHPPRLADQRRRAGQSALDRRRTRRAAGAPVDRPGLFGSAQRTGRQRPSHTSRFQTGYTESDPTDPVTVYGKTMVAAEQLIRDWMPAACMLRISLPMGVSFNGHAGAIDWIQSRFKHGRPATLYFDEVRTPGLHRLPQPPLRARAGERPGRPLPRRRPAGAVALRNRPSRQPRRRLRSRICSTAARESTPARFRREPATSP